MNLLIGKQKGIKREFLMDFENKEDASRYYQQ